MAMDYEDEKPFKVRTMRTALDRKNVKAGKMEKRHGRKTRRQHGRHKRRKGHRSY